jgi:catechol 2,3-dioxygenase-like lactoylglutathione lyase family enzyme
MLSAGIGYLIETKFNNTRLSRMDNFFVSKIDHLNIGVPDAEKSRNFYVAALAPLGIRLILSFPPEQAETGGDQARQGGWIYGFGASYKPYFWLFGNATVGQAVHIAFAAETRAQVDAFHAAALAAGGIDNGAPGLRRYHDHYYGAFVRDPDGINIEAVCHAPE